MVFKIINEEINKGLLCHKNTAGKRCLHHNKKVVRAIVAVAMTERVCLWIKKYAVLNTQHENYDQSAREGLSFLIWEKIKEEKSENFKEQKTLDN